MELGTCANAREILSAMEIATVQMLPNSKLTLAAAFSISPAIITVNVTEISTVTEIVMVQMLQVLKLTLDVAHLMILVQAAQLGIGVVIRLNHQITNLKGRAIIGSAYFIIHQ